MDRFDVGEHKFFHEPFVFLEISFVVPSSTAVTKLRPFVRMTPPRSVFQRVGDNTFTNVNSALCIKTIC
jgi:hypothetical protein